MTQIEIALRNKNSIQMRRVARIENIPLAYLRKIISSGKAVIPNNNRRSFEKVCGIGIGMRTKINANIGISSDEKDICDEIKKLKVAVEFGSDTVMDLSIGGDIPAIRKAMLKESCVPFGTVPVYEAAQRAVREKGSFLKMSLADILEVIQSQAEDGVDFMTIHSGITRKTVSELKKSKRVLDVVSRGGAILTSWIIHNKKENPFFEHFDKILDIAGKYDVTISLGDGLRPGSILDATDKAQLSELAILGKLARRAQSRKIQVIIEGPGHVPIDQIKKNVALEKRLCRGAPFYVLGPLVTDIASTRDHISGAIGGALAAVYGADFLCVVTPAEHLRHPSVDDVKEGVIASRIAAHAADIAKGLKGADSWDRKISIARKQRDWKKQISLSVDPEKAREYREASKPHAQDVCTMCSEYCSIKIIDDCLRA